MAKDSIQAVSTVPPASNGRHPGDSKPPKFGTPKPVETTGELPRYIDPLSRAVPGGPKRFKAVCRNYREPSAFPVKYILANSLDEAKKFYRDENKMDESIVTVAKPNAKTGQLEYVALEPEIVCYALAD
jgi:hypothetical protein